MSASTATGRPVSLVTDDAEALARAHAACAGITKRRGRNFYYGLRLTPEPKRSALYAVYAWMRAADDAADAEGTTGERRERLTRFGAVTRELLEDGALPRNAEPWWPAFHQTVRDYGLSHAVLGDMLDGLEDDLDRPDRAPAFADDEALDGYCYRVGSTVGLICVKIWGLTAGADEAEAERLAIRRGVAFQRTNILRDVTEDFEDGRVYLPADAFDRHGCDPACLARWSSERACRPLIAEQADIARRAYEESAALDGMISAECRCVLGAMTSIYKGILSRIESDPARITRTRVGLSRTRKTMIALRAAVQGRLARA